MKKIISLILSILLVLGAFSNFAFADKELNDMLVLVTKEASEFGKQYTIESLGIDGIKSVENLNFYESEEKAKNALVDIENYQTILKITAEDESEENLQRIFKELEEIDWIESVEFDGETEPFDNTEDDIENGPEADETIRKWNEKIYEIIKAEAEANPKYEDYKDLEFDDFTFNIHYKSVTGGIYIFDFQTNIHAYTQALEYEKIGDYVFTYAHGGKQLYAVYNANGEAKFGELRELYENGEIGDDVLDDLFDRNNGISIHKVGDINCDDNIDIVDVVSARNMIVSGQTYDFDQSHMIGSPYGFLADFNSDQCVDIVDVVIMRNGIVNG